MTLKERHKKVEENLGLVHSVAKKFTGKGVDYEDIVSAGCIGLIKAIDNFDESKGFKLSTYAVPAILGEIKRIWRDGGSIKVSRSLKELSIKISRLNEQSLKENGTELTVSELSEKLKVSAEEITEAISSARFPLSLSGYNDEEDEQNLDIPVNSCEEALTEKLSLEKAVKELNQQDRLLITLRYFKNQTQSATAKKLNMTQVQVSRREKKILATLRAHMNC
ncbi:MAG: sigma-70 family RNA polymerase sigma factor [Clostridia bacterium]|nr:sigma-70 family RNA polymerase sigma factor [Clostridia bacterium]